MWYLFFYLVAIAGPLATIFHVAAFALMAGCLACLIHGVIEEEDVPKRWGRMLFFWALGIGVFSALIPSKKDMLLIAAGGAIGEFVTHNKDAQALPADVVRWMHTELKAATDEISPAVQKKKEELESLDKEVLVKKLLAASDSIK